MDNECIRNQERVITGNELMEDKLRGALLEKRQLIE